MLNVVFVSATKAFPVRAATLPIAAKNPTAMNTVRACTVRSSATAGKDTVGTAATMPTVEKMLVAVAMDPVILIWKHVRVRLDGRVTFALNPAVDPREIVLGTAFVFKKAVLDLNATAWMDLKLPTATLNQSLWWWLLKRKESRKNKKKRK